MNCRNCGVTVEKVPWGDGNCHLTTSYRWFVAGWAKRLSWQEMATVFHTSWQSVSVGAARGLLGNRGPGVGNDRLNL